MARWIPEPLLIPPIAPPQPFSNTDDFWIKRNDGSELIDPFYSIHTKRTVLEYDYRTFDGRTFKCFGWDIEECRQKRDEWIIEEQRKERILKLLELIAGGEE